MSDLAWLDDIERRENAATQGPWEADEDGAWDSAGDARLYCLVRGPVMDAEYVLVNDARFIAHARADVPRLCRAVRELYSALEEVVKTPVCDTGGHLREDWLVAMGRACLALERWKRGGD